MERMIADRALVAVAHAPNLRRSELKTIRGELRAVRAPARAPPRRPLR
jgi:hypothetical protein